MLKHDWLLHVHYGYYVREMRLLAYQQLLQSYQSLTLKYMASSFGVTVDYIDRFAILVFVWHICRYFLFFFRELSRFISSGRLHCKIDKVNGIVETTRPDSKNWQYQV